nr:MAG: putative capsid protein [Narnaviridae sp.]
MATKRRTPQSRRVPNPRTTRNRPPARRPRRPRNSDAPGPYATVGRDIGSLMGFGDVGERVGGTVGRLFGKGDYALRTNSLISSYGMPSAGPSPPSFYKDGKRSVRIVEREYIGEVLSGTLSGGSTVFTNSSFRINPGDTATFPWLSQVANQFEQWEPNGIVFEFRSTSSEFNGTTQSLGVVVLATDYDARDAPYGTKSEMENSDYAMSVKAASSAVHGVECDPSERPTRLLFTGSPDSLSDLRLHDLGTFQIATQGMSAATVTLGELWVSYDITFYKKQIYGGTLGAGVITYKSKATAGISTSDYFGLANASFVSICSDENAIGLASGTTISLDGLPNGTYQLELAWYGASTAVVSPTLTYTNCAVSPEYTALGFTGFSNSGATATNLIITKMIKITSPGALIVLSGGTLPASADLMHLSLSQVTSAPEAII